MSEHHIISVRSVPQGAESILFAATSRRDGLEPGTRAYDQRRGGRGKGQCREFSA